MMDHALADDNALPDVAGVALTAFIAAMTAMYGSDSSVFWVTAFVGSCIGLYLLSSGRSRRLTGRGTVVRPSPSVGILLLLLALCAMTLLHGDVHDSCDDECADTSAYQDDKSEHSDVVHDLVPFCFLWGSGETRVVATRRCSYHT